MQKYWKSPSGRVHKEATAEKAAAWGSMFPDKDHIFFQCDLIKSNTSVPASKEEYEANTCPYCRDGVKVELRT